MITNFDEQLAIDFDVESAIFIQSLAQWTRRNAANDHNLHEGRYWSYNSYDALVKIFPYWSKKQIERLTAKCVKHGLIIKGNFNHKKYDKTNWYAMTDKALIYFPYLSKLISSQSSDPSPDSGSPSPDFGRPIPENTTSLSINNTINTNSESEASPATAVKKSKSTIDLRKLIEIYAHWFPDNPQPHGRAISTSLEKVLRTLIKRWPEAHPQGLPLTYDQFDHYMNLLSNNAPKFSKGEYLTPNGTKKKNNMVTFCRWDTFIQFLEGKYS